MGDSNAIAKKIEFAIKNKKEIKKIGIEGYNLFEKKCTKDIICLDLIQALKPFA